MDIIKEVASIKKRITKLERPFRGQYMTRTEIAEESGRSINAVQNTQNGKRNNERVNVKRLPEKNGKIKREDFEAWRIKNHSEVTKSINTRQMDVDYDGLSLVATRVKTKLSIEIAQQQVDELISEAIDQQGYPSDMYVEVIENYPIEDALVLVWRKLEQDHKAFNYKLRNP